MKGPLLVSHGPDDDAVASAEPWAGGPLAGKVRTMDEVYDWDRTRSQGLLVDVEYPSLGTVQLPGPPLRFLGPTADGERETTSREHRAPPLLDPDAQAFRDWAAGR